MDHTLQKTGSGKRDPGARTGAGPSDLPNSQTSAWEWRGAANTSRLPVPVLCALSRAGGHNGGINTRSLPELGRESPSCPWYCVLRRGRVGRRQLHSDHRSTGSGKQDPASRCRDPGAGKPHIAPEPLIPSKTNLLIVRIQARQAKGPAPAAVMPRPLPGSRRTRPPNTGCRPNRRPQEHGPRRRTRHTPTSHHPGTRTRRSQPRLPAPDTRPQITAGWSSPVARQAHNLKVAGSNPAPATIFTCDDPAPPAGFLLCVEIVRIPARSP